MSWGPWQEHDGSQCPIVGRYAQIEAANGKVVEGIAGTWRGPEGGIKVDCWDWSDAALRMLVWDHRVVAYRLRKPRGLTILESLLEDLPMETEEA